MLLSPEEQQQLVVEHLPYARMMSYAFSKPMWVDRDDLYQAACVGMIEAAATYDPEKGASFRTYARMRVLGEMIQFIATNSGMCRVMSKKREKIEHESLVFEGTHGRKPTIDEICKLTGFTKRTVKPLLRNLPANATSLSSLLTNAIRSGENESEIPEADLPDVSDSLVAEEETSQILSVLDQLTEIEKLGLSWWLYSDDRQIDTAEKYGLTRSVVHMRRALAIRKLRKLLNVGK